MIRELMKLNEFRSEIQNFAESVICEQSMFLNNDSYKERVLTESFALLVIGTEFYKKGFDLFNQAKEMRCYQESTYSTKLDISYTAQSFVGLAEQIFMAYNKEDRPMYFYTEDSENRIAVRGLLKLMSLGKFDRIESLVNRYVVNMFINTEYIDSLCKHISSMDKFDANIFVNKILEEGLYSVYPMSSKEENSFNLSVISGGLAEKEVAVSGGLAEKYDVISGGIAEKNSDELLDVDFDQLYEVEEDEVISGGLAEKPVKGYLDYIGYSKIPEMEVSFELDNLDIPVKNQDIKSDAELFDEIYNGIVEKRGQLLYIDNQPSEECITTSDDDIDEWDIILDVEGWENL